MDEQVINNLGIFGRAQSMREVQRAECTGKSSGIAGLRLPNHLGSYIIPDTQNNKTMIKQKVQPRGEGTSRIALSPTR